jgi:hypothetical protein
MLALVAVGMEVSVSFGAAMATCVPRGRLYGVLTTIGRHRAFDHNEQGDG